MIRGTLLILGAVATLAAMVMLAYTAPMLFFISLAGQAVIVAGLAME